MRQYGERMVVFWRVLGVVLFCILAAARPAAAIEEAMLNSDTIAVFYEKCMAMKMAFAVRGQGLPMWLNLKSVALDGAAPPRCSQPEADGSAQVSALLESATGRLVQARFFMSPGDVPGAVLLEMRPGEQSAAPVGIKLTFEARDAERFYGMDAKGNVRALRGSTVTVPAPDALAPEGAAPIVPLILSSRGYGLWVEGGGAAVFDMDSKAQGAWSLEVKTARLRVYFLAGPDPAQALERYNRLSGAPALEPDLSAFTQ